jgi:hypothetical protein
MDPKARCLEGIHVAGPWFSSKPSPIDPETYVRLVGTVHEHALRSVLAGEDSDTTGRLITAYRALLPEGERLGAADCEREALQVYGQEFRRIAPLADEASIEAAFVWPRDLPREDLPPLLVRMVFMSLGYRDGRKLLLQRRDTSSGR